MLELLRRSSIALVSRDSRGSVTGGFASGDGGRGNSNVHATQSSFPAALTPSSSHGPLLAALSHALRASALLMADPRVDGAGSPEARSWAARTAACMLAAALPLPAVSNETAMVAFMAAPNHMCVESDGGGPEGTQLGPGGVDGRRAVVRGSSFREHHSAAAVERAVGVCLHALEAMPPVLAQEDGVARFVGDVRGALREFVGGGSGGFRDFGDGAGRSVGVKDALSSPGGFVIPRSLSLSPASGGVKRRRRHSGDKGEASDGGEEEGSDSNAMVESPPPLGGGPDRSSSGKKKKKRSGKVSVTKRGQMRLI